MKVGAVTPGWALSSLAGVQNQVKNHPELKEQLLLLSSFRGCQGGCRAPKGAQRPLSDGDTPGTLIYGFQYSRSCTALNLLGQECTKNFIGSLRASFEMCNKIKTSEPVLTPWRFMQPRESHLNANVSQT